MRFFPFGCIWNHFATTQNSKQNGPNWCNYCKSLCHGVLLEFFITNAPDPHNWILSSHLHAFLSVWVHLGPFPYHTKLKAKRVQLVQLIQKFVWILAANAPDPHRWTLNSCFGVFLFCLDAFGTILLLHETCCKTRQTGAINAKVRATVSC